MEIKKATKQALKQHNIRFVLRTIYQNDQVSRADIARITNLTRPTVSNIVAELIEQELVVEVGHGTSVGGKPPMLLELHTDSHAMLCLDLGGTVFRGVLINLRGEIKLQVQLPLYQDKEEPLVLVTNLIDSLCEMTTMPILGIAVALPGLINPEAGTIESAVALGWSNLPLRALLEEKYQLPVYVVNDSHAAALAEYSYGAFAGAKSLVVLKSGRGVGAGVIIEGQPLYQTLVGAGEIGHIVVSEDGNVCGCGNRGCLETFISAEAILRQAHDLAKVHKSSSLAHETTLDWSSIRFGLAIEDAVTLDLIKYIGRYLCIAIANLIGCYHPEQIIIAGRLTELGEPLLHYIRQEITRRVHPVLARSTQITYSELRRDSVILGCAAIILKYELGVI